tara:strand:+ start:3152 stop:3718 length:567 start_codon:yes stop_codon:yes gene_type:complete
MKKIQWNNVTPIRKEGGIEEPMILPAEKNKIISQLTEVFVKPPYENDRILKDMINDIPKVKFLSTKNTIKFESNNREAIIEAWRLVKSYLVPQRKESLYTQLTDLQFLLQHPYGEDNKSRHRRIELLAENLTQFPADCVSYSIKIIPIKSDIAPRFPFLVDFVNQFRTSYNFRTSLRKKIEEVAKSID